MTLKVVDRVKETTTTTGTGTVNLAGAVTGFQTFVAGVGDTHTTYYAITDANGTAWEVGLGTVADASPDTLARTTLLASSTGSKISLSSGTHTVFATYPGGKAIFADTDGHIVPATTNTVDLGTASLEYKNAYFDGTVTSDAFAGPLTGDVTGNADTATTATTATNVTASANNSTDETVYPTFVDGATGGQGIETDTGLTYNPSTGTFTSTIFVGALTGNASGSSGSCTGNAATATVATTVTITDNENTDEDNAIIFTAGGDVDGGNIGLESDGTLTYNPSTGTVTSTVFVGALTVNASGSSGSCTGNAATVTNGVYTTSKISVLAATSSSELAGVISDETGSGSLVFSNSPTLVTPALGTPSALVGTNISGTAASLTAGTATALASGRTIAMTGDVAWTSASFDGSGNVTGTSTIGADTVHYSMLNDDCISGFDEITSGLIAADEFLYSDGGTLKRVGADTLATKLLGLATAGAVLQTADYMVFLDGGATGDVIIESIDDFLTAIAGSGISVSSSQLTASGGGGTPTDITVADESSDTTCFPLFVTAATGDLEPKSGSNLAFNSSTGVLTATGFAGPLTGNVTGNASGTAATVTAGTQAAITTLANVTTVGTIGAGVWQGTAIAGGYIANDAIDSQHYADGSVDFAHIQDVAANSILGRNANSSGVLSEIALATTQILIGDGTGFTAAALSGDVTMANDGAVTIADDVISSAELADACTAVTSFTAPLIEGSTSIQTPLIEYTDGDDAMTINDGGSVTFSAATIPAVVVGGTSGAVTLNSSTSNYFTITTSGNITDLIISNAVAGQRILVRIINGGSHTIAWTTDTIKWPGGTAPTLTTSSGTDVYGFINTGTNAFDGFIVGQALAAPQERTYDTIRNTGRHF